MYGFTYSLYHPRGAFLGFIGFIVEQNIFLSNNSPPLYKTHHLMKLIKFLTHKENLF